jgi:hypothetical protein
MANNIVQQIDRLVNAALNYGTGDAAPGMSVASGTGQATYGGNVGARVALDSASIRSISSVGTLYGGIYQYVYMTYTTTQPARGQLVFWDLSVSDQLYQVNGDAKPTAAIPTLIAGVVIQATVTKNTYAWMQIAGRASVLPDSAVVSGTAGNGVSAKVTPSVPSTVDVGVTVVTATAPIGPVDALIGIAEAAVTASTIFLCQLNSSLIRRI